MATNNPGSKRRRLEQACQPMVSGMNRSGFSTYQCDADSTESETIYKLLSDGRWDEVVHRATYFPHLVTSAPNPSPLAIACRSGAPFECVKALLEAAPERVRYLLDSRGTPLHEAIVCESTGPNVIGALLKADESLGSDSTRATLLQDVDGFVPLHLLIRRRFQSHILSLDEDMSLMEILEMLVSSCPESVTIPDRGEYEEPPLVYALKANIYAPSLGSEEDTIARIERQIFEMVQKMLKHAPFAAARVFSGFRGQYTALHSAVFHGRYTTTVDLILKTEEQYPHPQKAALLANTQGELPLHFCAMRGERPRTVALLANAAPAAVLYRDASGLTPFHWLWIRFVSTLMAMDEDSRAFTVLHGADRSMPPEANKYNEFTLIESGDFDTDLQLIRRIDPPVDFLRMRHIPIEVSGDVICLEWCDRSVDVLSRIRERHYETSNLDYETEITWTRQEAVVSLFWTKVVSMLEAAKEADGRHQSGESVLVHTAFASQCCLPSVAYLAASLFPDDLIVRDNLGRLPVHYAASRPWHAWDWRRDEGAYEHAARLLSHEYLETLRVALRLSPPYTARVADKDNRIVLHHVIDSFVRGCTHAARSSKEHVVMDFLTILRELLTIYPDALQRRDGVTLLYPFLQATATASELNNEAFVHDELHLTLTYELLRENPSLLSNGH